VIEFYNKLSELFVFLLYFIMDTLKNDLPEDIKLFFTKLSNYLDNKIYYYGSVQRSDYIHGESDIDIGILTDNEYSTMNKLQHYLNIDVNNFYKVAWKVNNNYVYGYKLQYNDNKKKLRTEFAIFNNKFKDIIIPEHLRTLYVPFYGIIMLHILKFFYYTLKIINRKTFQTLKRYIFEFCWGKEKGHYLVIKPK
jgi:predicted nucleotidyltransferase